jgi:hypothetical protein
MNADAGEEDARHSAGIGLIFPPDLDTAFGGDFANEFAKSRNVRDLPGPHWIFGGSLSNAGRTGYRQCDDSAS